ncbi:MAG TPA: aldehyde dehydrogenase [Novosphingobium sp.]|nr:aldehyde dehydrogenase [Novosphingobium sp.]
MSEDLTTTSSRQDESVWQGELDSDRAYKLLIDGEYVDAEDGRTFQCEYPATGEKWGAAPLAGGGDVDRAVRAARGAFDGWSRTRPMERARVLRKLADLLIRDAKNLALLQVHENGKLLSEMAGTGHVMAGQAYYMAGLAEVSGGHTSMSNLPDTTSYTVREPIGVVAAITPWNSPLGLLGWKLFPALAAGNTIVCKPSEVTPLSTLRLGELCQEAGIPAGVVNMVTGDGATGAALAEHALIDKIAFTGATGTGQRIASQAALRGVRVTLELGGKSPNIVFDDADFDKAIDGIIAGIFSATGQTCIAGSRILVQETVGEDFFRELAARVDALRIGDPLDRASQIAPLASRGHMRKVLDYFQIAEQDGSETLVGGGRAEVAGLPEGFFVKPTLYTGVQNGFRIAQEEVFGPIGAIIRFKDEDDAVRIANDTAFGLGGAVWTENVRRAHRMIPRIRAGTVWVNQYRIAEHSRPFGGYKNSGIGREMGLHALDPYTEEKSVFIAH